MDKKQLQREYYKIWRANKTPEELQKYKDKIKGFCEICNKQYANIYQHRKTLLHKNKNVE